MGLVRLQGLLASQEPHVGAASLGAELPLLTVLPFALLLLAIAILPLLHGRFWEKNSNKAIVAAVLSLPVLVYLGWFCGHDGRLVLEEKILEYVSFIVLLAALFVISGGVYLQGSLSGTPLMNTGFLGPWGRCWRTSSGRPAPRSC